ncbi:hypothetical protein [Paenibacillus aestuarii]|uniref:Endolytic transglycosylase MltG n=1 Tax=Paenibacillus aestuarii TaxID=516965 RepID=A0ABW0K570_9BACL|nr:hypothetical protein [Paenibacillus aestuarii]
MFKNRLFVFGLGFGIIVGAILLQVMLARPSATDQSGIKPDEMDPLKLKEQASKYYQVFEKDTKVYTQAELDANVAQKVKEETDKLAAAQPAGQPQPAAPTVTVRNVIYVQPSLDATAVTDLLEKSGVISDRKAFESEMQKQGGVYKIQAGPHIFEGKLEIPQVIANLMTHQ